MNSKRAQSATEYIMIFVIVVGAFIGIGNYVKRGLAGRWKAAADDLGDQYDPRVANSLVEFRQIVNARTDIYEIPNTTGKYTYRTDSSTVLDIKNGFISIGSY